MHRKIYSSFGYSALDRNEWETSKQKFNLALAFAGERQEDLNIEQFRIGYSSEVQKIYEGLLDVYVEQYTESSDPLLIDSIYYYHDLSQNESLRHLNYVNPSEFLPLDSSAAVTEVRLLQRHIRQQLLTVPNEVKTSQLVSQLSAARVTMLAQQLSSERFRILNRPGAYKPESFKSIQARLGSNMAGLLIYHVTNNQAFVIVATEFERDLIKLDIDIDSWSATVDSLLFPFHSVELYSNRSIVFRADLAYRLYEQLLKPISERFSLPERLIISANGMGQNIPFEMLLTKPPRRPNYTPNENADYVENLVVNKHIISYAAGTILLHDRPDEILQFANPPMLVVADPFAYGGQLPSEHRQGWNFSPLPYAKLESKRLMALQSNVTSLTGNLATRDNLKDALPNHQILHFATHGFN